MREICTSGSEGGEGQQPLPDPYHELRAESYVFRLLGSHLPASRLQRVLGDRLEHEENGGVSLCDKLRRAGQGGPLGLANSWMVGLRRP